MIQGQTLVKTLYIIEDDNTCNFVTPFACTLLIYMWHLHCTMCIGQCAL